MGADSALAMVTDMLWTLVRVCGPLLGAVMVVGLLVSIFQVVTQIQEMTLAFIPKMAVAVFVLMIFGGWMLSEVTEFAEVQISSIPEKVGK